jgi:hypothetical protein
MDDNKDTPRELASLGAEIQFAVQRVIYLHQHPDAKPGQPFVWDNEAVVASSFITGALFDLLLDAFAGDLPSPTDFQALLTDNGMDIRLKIRRNPNDSRPGIQLLRRMASSILLVPGNKELVISVTGTSVEAGFPR